MNEKDTVKNSKFKKVMDVITWGLFLLSFVPYLVLVKAAFLGADVGLFYSNIEYGFPAVYALILFGSIIPIYPVCLIYEIVYALIRYRKLSQIKKRIVIITPIILTILVVVPCTVHLLVSNHKDKNYYAEHKEAVWNYLRNHFSDEVLENSELTLKSRENGYFWLHLDKGIFDDIHYIDVHIDEEGNITDNFANNFSNSHMGTNEFKEEFGEYLDELYGVALNADLQAIIYNVDMRDFSYQDDTSKLFPKCEYEVTSVNFTVNRYDQNEIIAVIKDFYKNIIPQLPVRDRQDFSYTVIMDDRYIASIHSYDKDLDDNELTLFFSGYTYTSEEGPTIPSADIDVIIE